MIHPRCIHLDQPSRRGEATTATLMALTVMLLAIDLTLFVGVFAQTVNFFTN